MILKLVLEKIIYVDLDESQEFRIGPKADLREHEDKWLSCGICAL
jgi:hypothetical protein